MFDIFKRETPNHLRKIGFYCTNTEERRRLLSATIRSKYKDRIPAVVHVPDGSSLAPIKHPKFLVGSDMILARVCVEIRKHLKNIDESQAIFIFAVTADGASVALPPLCNSMEAVQARYQNADGFLYLIVDSENTFG